MQTARGASLSHTDSASATSRRAGVVVLLTLAVVVWAIDQITKWLAVDQLPAGQPVSLVGEFLQLRLVRNPGAAFGLAEGMTVVFTAVAVVVIVVVLRLAPRLGSLRWSAALGLLLGGATGNLTDRLLRQPAPFRGHVVDFLELPHWPVFNVADMAIVSAAALLAGLSLAGRRLDGTRENVSRATEEPRG